MKSLIPLGLLLLSVAPATVLVAAPQPRAQLHKQINDSEMVQLKGHVRPSIANAQDLGPVSDSEPLPRLSMHFALTASQHADLTQFLAQVQDPNSKNFHKFLGAEGYAARFGVNAGDLQKISTWLEQKGFSGVEVSRSKTFITFSGSASRVDSAFHTKLRHYQVGGVKHFANATNPEVPKALAQMVESIHGLNDFRLKSNLRVRPHYASGSGEHSLAPADFSTIYNVSALYGQGYDGTGVNIAIVGQSNVNIADLRSFRSKFGLPPNDPVTITVGGDPGIQADESESDLDLEWAGAVAKNANLVFVTAGPQKGGVYQALLYAIDNKLAPIVSISYGQCEATTDPATVSTFANVFKQANAMGITIIASSGDSGAAACDASDSGIADFGLGVNFPASMEWVTAVGGTRFNEGSGSYWNSGSAISYIPETVWNDRALVATGGGASTLFPKPAWQQAPNVPQDGVRDVPDLALAASAEHDGYLVCQGGTACQPQPSITGGTSASAPAFAGILALLIQKTGGPLGNINARLYTLATTAPSVFHNINTGDNMVPCLFSTPDCPKEGAMGYKATGGYSQTVGLGSVDSYNLVANWPDYGVSVDLPAMTINRGSSATAGVSVNAQNGFTGTVTLSCSVASTLTNVTCSAPGSISNSGKAALTLTAGSTASVPRWPFPAIDPRAPWLLLLAFGLLPASLLLVKRKRAAIFTTAPLCAMLMVATGCGGGSSNGGNPPPQSHAQTGKVTVTATNSGFSKSTSFTLTVQ